LTINSLPSISLASKVRILEFKIRIDLIQYAARGSPQLSVSAIEGYAPRDGGGETDPLQIVKGMHNIDDDGHAIKLGRAAGICQQQSAAYEDRDWMMVKGKNMWNKVHHMIVDSVLAPGPRWVRSAGMEEAWKVSCFSSCSTFRFESLSDVGCTQTLARRCGDNMWVVGDAGSGAQARLSY
jgi:hypothetical protein